MKKYAQKYKNVFFSFQLVLFEVAVVLGIFATVLRFDIDSVVFAGSTDYDLTSSVSGQTATIKISPATGVDGISLFIYNRNNGQQVDDFRLGAGTTSVKWTGDPGNYEARLVWIFSEVALRESFTISAYQPGWNLSAPSFNGSTVVFNFNPGIGADSALVIKNTSTNATAKDSGELPQGSTNYFWNDAPAGNYRAVLIYGLSEISNPVNFRVDRKAIMLKSEPRCNSNPYPNNVTVKHEWKPASGNFSSQRLQIATSSSFTSGLQEKSITSSTKAYELSGYGNLKNYYVRIKSTTNDGRTIYSRVQSFATSECPNLSLEVPLPTRVDGLPACVNNGEKFGSGLTFNWNTVSGATSYTVRLTQNVNTGGDYSVKSVNTNSATGVGSWDPGGNALVTWVSNGTLSMSPGITYFFAVSASNGSQNSGYNLAGRSLQVGPVPVCNIIPQAPTPTGVAGLPICAPKDSTFGSNLEFKWTAVQNATSYTIRLTYNVNTGGDFSTKTVSTTLASGTGGWTTGGNSLVTWVDNGNLALKPGVKYFYSVKAEGSGFDTKYDLGGKSLQVGPVWVCIGGGIDSDADGFSDSLESYIGTNINQKCGVDSLPPDINNDGGVSSSDQSLIAQKVTSSEGDGKYDKRMDMNADKRINSIDQGLVARYVGKSCSTLGVADGAVQGIARATNLRVAHICSDVPYFTYVAWDGVGDYWVDFTWDNWATYANKHVTNAWVTGMPGGYSSPGGGENPFYVLFPGREYKWRLWNGFEHFNGPSFTMPTCTSGVGAEYNELRDYMYMVGSNQFVFGDELKRVLYGLSGCETGKTWNPSAVSSSGLYVGLFQYDQGTWDTRLRENGYAAGSIPRQDGFRQIEFTGKYIMRERWLGKWPHCGLHWNDPAYLAGAP